MDFEERVNKQVACTRAFLVQGNFDDALTSSREAVAIQGEVIKATELAVQLTQKLLTAHEEKLDMLKGVSDDVEKLRNQPRRSSQTAE